ncbi:hypothetical protein G6F63_016458 [Rhizopus arrhizus]|nr:hypothetical protein G6F63_016458 [Rhizopus arrhizus]
MLDGGRGIGGERQPRRGMVGLHHRLQARLIDRDDAPVEAIDLGLVDVDADHLMTNVGQAGAGHQPYITGTENRNAHVRAGSVVAYGRTPSSSTSNVRVAFGPIGPPGGPFSP